MPKKAAAPKQLPDEGGEVAPVAPAKGANKIVTDQGVPAALLPGSTFASRAKARRA